MPLDGVGACTRHQNILVAISIYVGRDDVHVAVARGRGELVRGEGLARVVLKPDESAAATAASAFLTTGRAKDLQLARKLFMREHKSVFKVLGAMQNAYYRSDERRERFVSLCHDIDVQKLTFEAYMNKRLVAARPMAHLKIGLKNLAHLTRLISEDRV